MASCSSETHALDRKLLVLTAVSGIANAMNLAVINAAVDALRGGGPSWQHFLWFGLSIALFVYSLRYILYESTRIAEAAICSVRLRLADKIRRSDLLDARIDRRGRHSCTDQPGHDRHRPGGATAVCRRARRRHDALHVGLYRARVAGRHAAVPRSDRGRRRQILQGPQGLRPGA